MVTVLPPDSSTTFIAAVLVPLFLGFLVGIIAKSIIKIGLTILALILILIVAGVISPDQVVGPVVALFRSGGGLAVKVKQIAGFLPYSSITFLIGAAVGFFKG